MKNIVIIGANTIGYALADAIHQLAMEKKVEIVVANTNDSFIDNSIKEPIVFGVKNIEDLKLTELSENYYEHKLSKFISKPKNNYKRR